MPDHPFHKKFALATFEGYYENIFYLFLTSVSLDSNNVIMKRE